MSLARFHKAQAPVFDTALAELTAGKKRSHWMWFILPQLARLGTSAMAERYAIKDLAEARAYLADPILADRLNKCVDAILQHSDKSAHDILGSPDDLKFRSCLTLFEAAAPDDPLFERALIEFYDGQRDPNTLSLLSTSR
ncbi:MAG: DUF1810 domain-containing protein [Paracoccaceae bacterium]|nr:DUF1810 domain-containing protein [Paracoccaceae bacterium]